MSEELHVSEADPDPRASGAPAPGRRLDVLDLIQDGYYETDPSGTVTAANEALCGIAGRPHAELVGHTFARFMDTTAAAYVRDAFTEVWEQQAPRASVAFDLRRPDGERRAVEVSVALLRDADGHRRGFTGIVRDVTDRARVAELEAERQLLQASIDALAAQIVVLDADGAVSAVNATWRESGAANALGARPASVGANYLDVLSQEPGISPHDAATLTLAVEQITRGAAGSVDAEIRRDAAGGPRHFAVRLSPLPGREAGKVVIAHTEITETVQAEAERRRLEDELRSSEQRYRSLVDDATDYIYEIGTDGTVRFANRAAQTALGYGRNEADVSVADLVAGGREELEARLVRAPGAEPGATSVWELRRRDGRSIWVEAVNRPVLDAQGTPVAVRGIARDITRQKLAEEAVRVSEERWRRWLDNATDPICVVGDDLRVIYANDAACVLIDRSRDEIVGRPYGDFLTAPDRDLLPERFAQLRKAGRGTFHPVFVRPDGSEVPTEVRVVDMGDGTFQGTARDISPWLEAQEQLRQNEAILARAQALARLGSCEWERGSGVFRWSDETYRILGCDREAFTPTMEAFLALVDAQDRARIGETIAAAERENGVRQAIFRVRRPDGSERTISAQLGPVGPGSATIAGAFQDITELTEASRALAATEALLRTVMDNAQIIVFSLDAQGTVRRMEGRGLELLGLEEADLTGQLVQELFQMSESDVVPLTEDGDGVTGVLRFGGHTFEVRYTAEREESGAITGYVGMGMDVTARSQLEEQLRQAQKMEAVGRLAGGVAHDFNNLLTVIAGYSEMLQMGLGPESPLRQELSQIQGAVERAAGLTRQLLAFSRQQMLQPRVLDINSVIVDMEKMLRRVITAEIRLQATLGPDAGSVVSDQAQLEHTILNLVLNACDAMPAGGDLFLSTERVELDRVLAESLGVEPGPYVRLLVRDSGAGMDDRTKAQIFEPFFTTKEIGKGTGLGLATVYGFVRQSGGGIQVDSEPGSGTTFQVYLPEATRETDQAEPAPAPSPVRTGSGTILLAEDEDGVRQVLQRTLEDAGYTVLAAPDGAAALRTLVDHPDPVDVLLTDVVMPTMRGPELAEAVKRQDPWVRVIYMSGYAEPSRAGLEGSLDEHTRFLQKPVARALLLDTLREVLAEPPGL